MKQIDGWYVPEYTPKDIKEKQMQYCVISREFGQCDDIECKTCLFDTYVENQEAFKKWLKEKGE